MLNKANTAFVVCPVWGAGRMWHKHICRSGRHRGGVLWGRCPHRRTEGRDVHKEAVSTDIRIQMCAPAHCTGNKGNTRKYKEMHRNAKQGIKE